MAVDSRLSPYVEAIDRRLTELLDSAPAEPKSLREAMSYAALGPGKRIRPLMTLLACHAVGGEVESALDAAGAVELVHAFSLVHDDLPALDDDDLRRGRPTVHVGFGEATALLAGDALFALAFQTVASCDPRCVASLAGAAIDLVHGEAADIESQGLPAEVARVETIHSRKTGALFACACEVGAICGGGDAAQVAGLKRFGADVGLAFQIVDDVIDAASGGDAPGKQTYPAAIGLLESTIAAREIVLKAVESVRAIATDASPLALLALESVSRTR